MKVVEVNVFTSHYVSINSEVDETEMIVRADLHPTMYLLILHSTNKIQ